MVSRRQDPDASVYRARLEWNYGYLTPDVGCWREKTGAELKVRVKNKHV
jgi:hypothetical protein